MTARASGGAVLARTEAVLDELTSQVHTRAAQVSHITIEAQGLALPGQLSDDSDDR